MNNAVNTLFMSYNNLDLVNKENIVLESETKLLNLQIILPVRQMMKNFSM